MENDSWSGLDQTVLGVGLAHLFRLIVPGILRRSDAGPGTLNRR